VNVLILQDLAICAEIPSFPEPFAEASSVEISVKGRRTEGCFS